MPLHSIGFVLRRLRVEDCIRKINLSTSSSRCLSTWPQSCKRNKYPYMITRSMCDGSPAHIYSIRMPDIMDAKEGTVEKWLKKEGDFVKSGEALCEVTVGDIYLGVEGPENCFISEIMYVDGKIVPVGTVIAKYVHTKDEYFAAKDSQRVELADKTRAAETAEVIGESTKKPDTKTLLKEVRHLISSNHIEEGSEFAKQLQSLARKGDPDLMAVFEASFEGASFNVDTFDTAFFLDNAKEILKERNLLPQ